MRLRPLSLRSRLLAGMLGLVTIGLVALGVTSYFGLESVLVKRVATAVSATSRAAVTTLGALRDQHPDASRDQVAAALEPLLSNGEVLVWVPDSGDPVLVADGPAPFDLRRAMTRNAAQVSPADPWSVWPESVDHRDYQVAAQLVPSGGGLAVAAPLSDVDKTLNSLLLLEAAVGGALLLLLTGIGIFVVRGGLRPLDAIVRTAGAITRGDRGQRIPLPAGDTEVGRVSAALNQMLDETEASFAAQRASEERLRQFIADASHELRTPLATVRSYAELLRTGAAGTAADRGLAVDRIESESTRMSELVEDLLLLARLDMGRPLRSEPVELAGLVRQAVADENAIDADRPRHVTVTGDTLVRGDENRLRQVLVNLLTNARCHTPPGTPIEIELSRGVGEVRLSVADRGPGLSEEQLHHVFERFYRADAARTHRSDGGSGVGLGLSIVAAIVAAHHGTVRAAGAPGEGARFTVTLPAGHHDQ